ncbi:MAG TPA: hypothetical protein VFY17_01500, partial [Pilimelia sp.]|nr:hypothetical protein [Pilimelia sp.]
WLCTWEKLWLAERGDPDTAALALAKVAQARDMTSYRQLPAAERATVEADIAKARAGDASGFTAYAAVHC